jgi:hypothetical protein
MAPKKAAAPSKPKSSSGSGAHASYQGIFALSNYHNGVGMAARIVYHGRLVLI